MSRRYIYDKMSPEEFRAYLENTGHEGWQDGYRFARLFAFDPSGIAPCEASKPRHRRKASARCWWQHTRRLFQPYAPSQMRGRR
jgi:hypothetical protein